MAEPIKKVRILKKDLPPLSIFSLDPATIGHYVRYRISSNDQSRTSHWSQTHKILVPNFSVLGEAKVNQTASTISVVWGDQLNRPKYDIYVRWGNKLNKIDTVGTTATVYSISDHGFSAGDIVEIVGTGLSYIDTKTFVVTPVTGQPKRFTITIQSGIPDGVNNVPSTSEAKTLYTYHGTSPIHTYSFLRLAKFDLLHVDVQVESIEKVYTSALLIYDSPAITLT